MKYAGPMIQCIVTGDYGADLHHVKSRGSGGTDDNWNLMPLKHKLHVECEQIGLNTFANRYPEVKDWLTRNGWELIMGRWRHPKYFPDKLELREIKEAVDQAVLRMLRSVP